MWNIKYIVVILLSFPMCSYAQAPSLRLSVKPFLSHSIFNASKGIFADIKDTDKSIPKLGFSLKGSYAFSLDGRHRMSIGLGYANWNGTFRDDAAWMNNPGVYYDFYKYSHTHELVVPVDIWLYSVGESLTFFGKFGAQVGYLVSYRGGYEVEEPMVGLSEGPTEDKFSKTNIGIHVAFGVEKKLSERMSFYLAPEVHGYILTDGLQLLLHDIRRSGLGLEVGLDYRLRKKRVVINF